MTGPVTGVCTGLILLLGAGFASGSETTPALGRTPTASELAALEQHVFPDGSGLPEGSGNSMEGKTIYAAQCAGCHGNEGQGASAMELVGDRRLLATEYPDRGIGVYWPYAPTLFEYIRRAMPPDKPYSLNNDELYAVIAWLLELNGLLQPGQQLDSRVLSAVQMPNRNGFSSDYEPVD